MFTNYNILNATINKLLLIPDPYILNIGTYLLSQTISLLNILIPTSFYINIKIS